MPSAGTMSVAPVDASPVPLPVFPVEPVAAFVDAAATVVEVVDDGELVEVVEAPPVGVDVVVALAVTLSPSNSVATLRSAATMAGVGGADPRVSSSDLATGPTANRMYWASFCALAGVRPDVGTTR